MDLCPDSPLPRNLPDGTGVIVLRDRHGILTPEAVRHIEPYPHGIWAVTNTFPGGFTLTYSAQPGTLYYIMNHCSDMVAVRQHCRNHFFVTDTRPIVVNQIGNSSAASAVAAETTENDMVQLPLRPHPPAFDGMSNSTEPAEADQVSGNLGDQIIPGSLNTTQADGSASNDAATGTVSFQDIQMPAHDDPPINSIPGHASGDLEWNSTMSFFKLETFPKTSSTTPSAMETSLCRLKWNKPEKAGTSSGCESRILTMTPSAKLGSTFCPDIDAEVLGGVRCNVTDKAFNLAVVMGYTVHKYEQTAGLFPSTPFNHDDSEFLI